MSSKCLHCFLANPPKFKIGDIIHTDFLGSDKNRCVIIKIYWDKNEYKYHVTPLQILSFELSEHMLSKTEN